MAEKDEAMVGNRKFKELSPREQDQWMIPVRMFVNGLLQMENTGIVIDDPDPSDVYETQYNLRPKGKSPDLFIVIGKNTSHMAN